MQIMTNSRQTAFRACRRLHHYRYELLRRPIVVARPLAVGSLVHVGLEAWWSWFLPEAAGGKRAASPYDAAAEAMAARLAKRRPDDAEISPFNVAAAEAMLIGYDARWCVDVAENWEVIAVEAPFATALINPDTGRASQSYRLAGKMDAIVRRRADGHEGIVEHKTTASGIEPGSSYWPKLRMDAQVSTYYAGARSIGFDPRFVLYDVLSKPSQEPRKATPVADRKYRKTDGALYAKQRENDETPAEYRDRILADVREDPNGYYARAEVIRTESELLEHAWDVWQTTKSLHETRLSGRHSRNPDACWSYHRACDYWSVCTGSASISDDYLFRTSKSAHEELATEEAAVAAAAAAAREEELYVVP